MNLLEARYYYINQLAFISNEDLRQKLNLVLSDSRTYTKENLPKVEEIINNNKDLILTDQEIGLVCKCGRSFMGREQTNQHAPICPECRRERYLSNLDKKRAYQRNYKRGTK